MDAPLTGGCQCGVVRYECSAEPIFTGNCHCRECQKASGGAYVPAIGIPTDALKITGAVKYFESRADSGHTVSRGFCAVCGGRLFGKSAGMPGITAIMAGSLDDPSRFKPAMDIYTSSAQPWDHMNPQLPKFARLPQQ